MDLLDELEEGVVVADGAMGTELLTTLGATAGSSSPPGCLEALCLEQPDLVREMHGAYLQAGARLISTHTFGANAVRLATHGFEHRVSELNWTAAQLARECAQPFSAMVAGSVGPLGVDDAEVRRRGLNRTDLFMEQIGALLDGGVRIIQLETFTDLPEARAALEAKQTLHHCPAIALLAVDQEGRLPSGCGLEEAFAVLREAGADVVGVNCTPMNDALLDELSRLARQGSVAVRPSAGLPSQVQGRLHYPVSPEEFARAGARLASAGVQLLGGCCGAGPAHIAALVRACGDAPG